MAGVQPDPLPLNTWPPAHRTRVHLYLCQDRNRHWSLIFSPESRDYWKVMEYRLDNDTGRFMSVFTTTAGPPLGTLRFLCETYVDWLMRVPMESVAGYWAPTSSQVFVRAILFTLRRHGAITPGDYDRVVLLLNDIPDLQDT